VPHPARDRAVAAATVAMAAVAATVAITEATTHDSNERTRHRQPLCPLRLTIVVVICSACVNRSHWQPLQRLQEQGLSNSHNA
jgi:hypothetical protein